MRALTNEEIEHNRQIAEAAKAKATWQNPTNPHPQGSIQEHHLNGLMGRN
jgi:hypothetical protein